MIDFTRFVERYEQFNASLFLLITSPKAGSMIYISGYAGQRRILMRFLLSTMVAVVILTPVYDILARQLSYVLPVCVCLVDIRGHGRSAGVRGEASSPVQIWRDVDVIIDYVRTSFPDARIHMLGHSSGGGMLIKLLYSILSIEECLKA